MRTKSKSNLYRIALHILVPVVIALAINGIIYAKGWNKSNGGETRSPWLPPGVVIGLIWIILFGLLGYAHYLVRDHYSSWIIVGLIVYCLSYPWLTAGLQMAKASLWNSLSLIFACVTFISVLYKNEIAAGFVAPLVLWSAYVNMVAE